MKRRANFTPSYKVRLGQDVWVFNQEKKSTKHKNQLRRLLLDRVQDLEAYHVRLAGLYHLCLETLGPGTAGLVSVRLYEISESLSFARGMAKDPFKWSKVHLATLLLERTAELMEKKCGQKREDSVRKSLQVFRRQLRDTIARQAMQLNDLRRLPEYNQPKDKLKYVQN